MDDQNTNHETENALRLSAHPNEADLLAAYGAHLEDECMTEEQAGAFLVSLWQIMQAFVDLGFSVRSGDKFTPESDIGMDDVLGYLIPIETAPETVAPQNHQQEQELP